MAKQLYFILCMTEIHHSEHATIWRKLINGQRRGTPPRLILLESHSSSIVVSLLFLTVVVAVIIIIVIIIHSFTLFSVYPYTGKVPRMWITIVINNYNIRTITFKLCELLPVSHTINKIKIITIKMCVVIIIIYY